MKKLVLLFLVNSLLLACGGGLTDEQRKKIKEEMAASQIKKVTEAQIIEAALEQGRGLSGLLLKKHNADSLALASNTKIKWLVAGQSNATEIENQLIEAYIAQTSGGTLDNVQKIGTDSLLYTIPVIEKRGDGIDEVLGIWSICFSRKQIVLGI